MLFRKKPVVVEANQLTMKNVDAILDWITSNGGRAAPISGFSNNACNDWMSVAWISIFTLEGEMQADYGDYIIKGVNGEFYPCKPDIFLKTYDRVETE